MGCPTSMGYSTMRIIYIVKTDGALRYLREDMTKLVRSICQIKVRFQSIDISGATENQRRSRAICINSDSSTVVTTVFQSFQTIKELIYNELARFWS